MGSNETSAQEAYNQFWPKATEDIRALGNAGLKHQELPLARIKKVKICTYLHIKDVFNSFSFSCPFSFVHLNRAPLFSNF